MISVLVFGSAGKMGSEVCRALLDEGDLKLIGGIDLEKVGKDLGEVIRRDSVGIKITDKPDDFLENKPDVMVDFTQPSVVMENIRWGIKNGINIVVGTTGINQDNLKEIESLLRESSSNVFVAPNFAIGAVVMIELCKIASKFFNTCEIIEMHHDKKADAPSGTSIKTAENLGISLEGRILPHEKEIIEHVRGGIAGGAHIHSIRLPGLVAHQEVIFGGQGQTLAIRHDSIDRTSFMPGIIMAIREVGNLKGLTYGLEKILDF